MYPLDQDIRETILNVQGNIVIAASAGTGKTYTTVQRIIKDSNYRTNYQTFAAITFTRKAAKEIIKRLGPKKGEGFIGTNDNFIWLEIIQPFMYDVYGSEYKVEIKPDFSDDNQIKTFKEGIYKIKNTHLMCKYSDSKENFAFQLALKIIQNSHSCKRYIKSKYYRIYIDEYQDSDRDMHQFFMYLCNNLQIPLFIVGDSKQSIYSWRGAYSDGFKDILTNNTFESYELYHNFRSNKVLQNYSNIFMEETRKYYQYTEFNNEVILKKYSNYIEAVDYIDAWIVKDKKCAFLNFSNRNAESWSNRLNNSNIPFAFIPTSPLDYTNLESEHIWIVRSIAQYILQNRYSEYDFMDEVPMPEAYTISKIRKFLVEAKDSRSNYDNFQTVCLGLYNYLGFSRNERNLLEIEKLYQVINDNRYIPTYNQDSYKLTAGTIHSSKGLEFEQVIIDASDYNLSDNDITYLHYVAISRPEERLLILANDYVINRYKSFIHDAIKNTRSLGVDVQIDNIIKIVE